MTTETPNTEPKAERKRRNQSYVVLERMSSPDLSGSREHWAPVGEIEIGQGGDVFVETEFDDLAACDRWIRNHGEDGSTYRPARVADAVEVTTRTETVRELKTL
jgi:hypothetical protein